MKLLHLLLPCLLIYVPGVQAVNAVAFPRRECSGSTLKSCIGLPQRLAVAAQLELIASANFFSL